MHPNPAFRQMPNDRNLAFARARGFGILMVNGTDGPLAAHIPFVLAKDGGHADLHLVRSNPVARALTDPVPAILALSGADGYISPDWYGLDDQVPTWNYVAVHLRGVLTARPTDELPDHLDDLSAEFENRLLPKPPWLTGKLSADVLTRFLRMIVPCRLTISDVQGTWKLGQNKPQAARRAAARGVSASGIGCDTATLAGLMRDVAD